MFGNSVNKKSFLSQTLQPQLYGATRYVPSFPVKLLSNAFTLHVPRDAGHGLHVLQVQVAAQSRTFPEPESCVRYLPACPR